MLVSICCYKEGPCGAATAQFPHHTKFVVSIDALRRTVRLDGEPKSHRKVRDFRRGNELGIHQNQVVHRA